MQVTMVFIIKANKSAFTRVEFVGRRKEAGDGAAYWDGYWHYRGKKYFNKQPGQDISP